METADWDVDVDVATDMSSAAYHGGQQTKQTVHQPRPRSKTSQRERGQSQEQHARSTNSNGHIFNGGMPKPKPKLSRSRSRSLSPSPSPNRRRRRRRRLLGPYAETQFCRYLWTLPRMQHARRVGQNQPGDVAVVSVAFVALAVVADEAAAAAASAITGWDIGIRTMHWKKQEGFVGTRLVALKD